MPARKAASTIPSASVGASQAARVDGRQGQQPPQARADGRHHHVDPAQQGVAATERPPQTG
ncbi:hypothetical protein NKG94_13115 [Micromonospora sp. M12]